MFDIDFSQRRRCLDHLAAAIGRTPLAIEPFPHFVVRGFFPADVYGALLDLRPAAGSYGDFSLEKHHNYDGASNRRHFRMLNAEFERLDGRRQSFWRTIRSIVGSPELKQLTFSKLAPALAFRYGIPQKKVADLPGFALPELFCESAGYVIKPHPDTRRKVVTMQIALPRDATQRELGTEFYRRSLNPLSYVHSPRGFVVTRTMEFLPNTAYAFAVLNTFRLKSWHGRSTIPPSEGERHSLLNIWYEKLEDANEELAAENRELAMRTRLAAAA
jgi:hypothetical protein